MPETKWYHSRAWVVLMLFAVLGPFGLPLLWKSPRFSRLWKRILTALTLIYAALAVRILASAVTLSLRTLSSLGYSSP